MRRSSARLRRRPNGSNSSARVAHQPPTTPTAGGPIAPPDHANRLSQGIVLQGTILARVLGLRVQKLDTTLTILPAAMRQLATQAEQRRLAPSLDLETFFTRSVEPRHSLSEAVKAIQQSRELLAQARENRHLGSTNPSDKPVLATRLPPRRSTGELAVSPLEAAPAKPRT